MKLFLLLLLLAILQPIASAPVPSPLVDHLFKGAQWLIVGTANNTLKVVKTTGLAAAQVSAVAVVGVVQACKAENIVDFVVRHHIHELLAAKLGELLTQLIKEYFDATFHRCIRPAGGIAGAMAANAATRMLLNGPVEQVQIAYNTETGEQQVIDRRVVEPSDYQSTATTLNPDDRFYSALDSLDPPTRQTDQTDLESLQDETESVKSSVFYQDSEVESSASSPDVEPRPNGNRRAPSIDPGDIFENNFDQSNIDWSEYN